MKRIYQVLTLAVIFSVAMNACKKEDDDAVTKPCTPPASPKVTNNSPVSIGDTVQFITEAIAGATYSWTGPNGFSSSLQSPTLIYSSANAGDYLVTATVNGCTSAAFHSYVTSLDVVASSDTGVVTGGKLNLSASNVTDAYGSLVGATYSWTGPNSFKSSVQNPLITAVTIAAAGTYSVTATLNGKTGKVATTTVAITPAAATAGSNSNNSQVKVKGTLNLTASSVSGATYSWKGPNGFTSSLQNPTIANVTKAAEGKYTLSYVLSGVTSKESSTNVKIGYSNSGCGGDTLVSVNGITYKVVEIGTQCWTKENLRKLGASAQDSMSWTTMKANGIAINQGACPIGWHLPNDTMWQDLTIAVSGNGNALKAVGQDTTVNGLATDASGFSAKLGLGLKGSKSGFFWSSTESEAGPRCIQLSVGSPLIYFTTAVETKAYYVRCLKD